MRTLRFLALCIAGCGADAAPGSAFIGTWSFASGTSSFSCPTGTTMQTPAGNVTIKTGTSSDLVVLDPKGCDFPYKVSGNSATTQNQSCTFPAPEVAPGVTAAATFSFITLTTTDGKSMSDVYGGNVTYSSTAGSLDCTFSGSATLTKVATN